MPINNTLPLDSIYLDIDSLVSTIAKEAANTLNISGESQIDCQHSSEADNAKRTAAIGNSVNINAVTNVTLINNDNKDVHYSRIKEDLFH